MYTGPIRPPESRTMYTFNRCSCPGGTISGIRGVEPTIVAGGLLGTEAGAGGSGAVKSATAFAPLWTMVSWESLHPTQAMLATIALAQIPVTFVMEAPRSPIPQYRIESLVCSTTASDS